MKKLEGKVVSFKMQNTAVIEVLRTVVHPLYKKRLKRSKRYKVDTNGQEISLGETVTIVETKPISKDKHFKIVKTEKQNKTKIIDSMVKKKTSESSKKSRATKTEKKILALKLEKEK